MKNYINIINKVWNIREQGLIDVYEQDLLLYLIQRCNRSGWINPFPQSSKVICAVLGVNRNALIRRRKKLEALGLLSTRKGQEKSASTYYCLHLDTNSVEKTNDMEDHKSAGVFRKPQVGEIADYCMQRNNSIDAEAFFDYYESKGWVVGNHPMKDWKAAVRTWEMNRKKRTPTVIAHAFAHHNNDKDYGQF